MKATVSRKQAQDGVSIVIPFRNEASHLPEIISCLKNQIVEKPNFEVLMVNDHSSDGSEVIVLKEIEGLGGFSLISLEELTGKKAALKAGISDSRFNWIVTLDADVSVGKSYLSRLFGYLNDDDVEMIILPLFIIPKRTFLAKFQSLESLILMGITGGMATIKRPILCNGANLAFRKESYFKCEKTRNDNGVSSGDDVFLLEALEKNKKVKWVHDLELLATTEPINDLKSFVDQRIRWASKTSQMSNSLTKTLAIITWITNLIPIWILIEAIGNYRWWPLFLCSLLMKMTIDFTLLFPVSSWTKNQSLLFHFPLASLIYPFYSTLIPLIGLFYSPEWKGRTISLHQKRNEEN